MNWVEILEAPLWLSTSIIALLALIIVIPTSLIALRRSRADRTNDNTVTAALRLAGSALVLIGGFIAVQNFQLEVQHEALITDELSKAEAILAAAASASTARRQALGETIRAYGTAVAGHEFNRLTGLPHIRGTRGDPNVEQVMARIGAAVETAASELAGASRAADASSLRAAWRSLRNAREQRLSFRELLPPPLIAVLLVCSACTLVIAGAYPAGSSSALKWLQSISAALIVAVFLALQILIVSPIAASEHRGHLVDRLLRSVDATLASG